MVKELEKEIDCYNLQEITWYDKDKYPATENDAWAWTLIKDYSGSTYPAVFALVEDIENYGEVNSMGYLLTVNKNLFLHRRLLGETDI